MTTTSCPPERHNPDQVEELFPSDSTPQIRLDELSALCSYGVTPLVMQGALRQVLTEHFVDPRGILNAKLRQRFERDGGWDSDAAKSSIIIESLHHWKPTQTEKRPGLILKEGAWTWQRLGFGDQYSEDSRTGRTYHHGQWMGSHTIFALANEGAEAQILATETMKKFVWFAREISSSLNLLRFVPVSIGEVAALHEAKENYVVPVTVGYVVPESWWLQPEAPRLKKISFRTSFLLQNY